MNDLKEYLVPYIISNFLFAISVLAALKRPMWARIFLAILFLWASYINSRSVIRTPEIYLDYARLTPVHLYKEFINGLFSRHIQLFTISVAIGQFCIFGGFLLNDGWVKMSCGGGIIFGLAIAPLGVGSAFPATVLMAIACLILSMKYDHDFIWIRGQYKIGVTGK